MCWENALRFSVETKAFAQKRKQHHTRLTVHQYFTVDFVFHIAYTALQFCSDERLLLKNVNNAIIQICKFITTIVQLWTL